MITATWSAPPLRIHAAPHHRLPVHVPAISTAASVHVHLAHFLSRRFRMSTVYSPPQHTEPIPQTTAPTSDCRSARPVRSSVFPGSLPSMYDSPSAGVWAAEPQGGYLDAGAGTVGVVPHSGHLASAARPRRS